MANRAISQMFHVEPLLLGGGSGWGLGRRMFHVEQFIICFGVMITAIGIRVGVSRGT